MQYINTRISKREERKEGQAGKLVRRIISVGPDPCTYLSLRGKKQQKVAEQSEVSKGKNDVFPRHKETLEVSSNILCSIFHTQEILSPPLMIENKVKLD